MLLCVSASVAALAVAAPLRAKPALTTACGEISDYAPAWSPDGRFLAFTRVRGSGAGSGVFRIGLDGRHQRRISAAGDYAYGAVWSPDGRRIAYATFDLAAVVRIVVARADGTAAHVVATFQGEREPPATFLSWSPDGAWVAYVDSAGDLVAADSGGGGVQRLIAHGATQRPTAEKSPMSLRTRSPSPIRPGARHARSRKVPSPPGRPTAAGSPTRS